MKTIKIIFSIVTLAIATGSFGQLYITPDQDQDKKQLILASTIDNPGLGIEALIEEMGNLTLEANAEIQSNASNRSEFEQSHPVPEISAPYAIDPPELFFEPYLGVEEWMITPFDY